MWSLKYDANEIIDETEQNHGHGEQTSGFQGEGGSSRDGVEGWVSRYKLLYIEWIDNKVLMCSTDNYINI